MFFKHQLDVCYVEGHYGSHIVLYIPPTLKYEAYALVRFGASFYCRDKNCCFIGLWIRVAYASANISAVLDILSVFVVVELVLKRWTSVYSDKYSKTLQYHYCSNKNVQDMDRQNVNANSLSKIQ